MLFFDLTANSRVAIEIILVVGMAINILAIHTMLWAIETRILWHRRHQKTAHKQSARRQTTPNVQSPARSLEAA